MAVVVFILSLLTIFTSVGFLFAWIVHFMAKRSTVELELPDQSNSSEAY